MHILVVEHNPERLRAVTGALVAAGHRAEGVATGGSALACLARPAPPDLLLLADQLPDMPALDLLQAVEGMGLRLPVVLIGTDAGAARGVESTRLGTLDYIETDAASAYLRTLPARVNASLELEAKRDAIRRMADALASTAAAVILTDRAGHIEMMNEACVRLLGRDIGQTDHGELLGLFPLEDEPRLKSDLVEALHRGDEWAGELDARTREGDLVTCLVTLSPIRRDLDRVDGLVLTLRDVSDRVAMEDALRAANRRLADLASRDALTNLYNRAYFREILDREMARARRYGDVLSVVMADLDSFKVVNDERGHAAGDQVLRDVARLLRPHLRDGDVLARYGGDEFCILLPNTHAEAARGVAERLRLAIEQFDGGDHGPWTVRMSAGLATSEDVKDAEPRPEDRNHIDLLLGRADAALYASKAAGGNRVMVWRPHLA